MYELSMQRETAMQRRQQAADWRATGEGRISTDTTGSMMPSSNSIGQAMYEPYGKRDSYAAQTPGRRPAGRGGRANQH